MSHLFGFTKGPMQVWSTDVCLCARTSAPVRVHAWVAKVQIDAKINYEHVVRIGMRLTWCEPVTWPCWAAVPRLWCRWTINPHPHVWHRADEASACSVTGRQRCIGVTMKTEAPPPPREKITCIVKTPFALLSTLTHSDVIVVLCENVCWFEGSTQLHFLTCE